VDRLSKDPRFANVKVFRLDYDKQKDAMRQLKVSDRATLVAFKGKTEKARSSGEVDPKALQKIFEAALR
jgi:hypothetical protein